MAEVPPTLENWNTPQVRTSCQIWNLNANDKWLASVLSPYNENSYFQTLKPRYSAEQQIFHNKIHPGNAKNNKNRDHKWSKLRFRKFEVVLKRLNSGVYYRELSNIKHIKCCNRTQKKTMYYNTFFFHCYSLLFFVQHFYKTCATKPFLRHKSLLRFLVY